MYLPKFEKVTGKDELREALMNVCITEEYTVATDAHILTWQKADFPVDLIDFIRSEIQVFIPGEQWKKISGKDIGFIAVDKHALVFKDKKKCSKIFVEYTTKETADFRYPQWESVLPVDLKTKKSVLEIQPLPAIGFNPSYLDRIRQAFDLTMNSCFRLDFFGTNRPILVTHETSDKVHFSEKGAILMPATLEASYGFEWL